MSQLNDCKFLALRDQGYTGAIDDMEIAWGADNGLPDGTVGVPWYNALVAAGYTGHINDMELSFWCSGGTFTTGNWIREDGDNWLREDGDLWTVDVTIAVQMTTAHYFDMSSLPPTDLITGNILSSGASGVIQPGTAPNSLGLDVWSQNGDDGAISGSGWEAPGNRSMVMIFVAQARDSGAGDAGALSLYMGDSTFNNTFKRIQTYKAGGNPESTENYITANPVIIGQNYAYGMIYRSNTKKVEHYTYDVVSDSLVVNPSTVLTDFSKFIPPPVWNASHGGTTPPNFLDVVESIQDYFSWYIGYTENAPTQNEMLIAMRDHLSRHPTGDKSIYSPWA